MSSNVDKHSVEGEEAVRLCNYVDVYKNDLITSDMDFMLATASAAQIERLTLHGGYVIISKNSLILLCGQRSRALSGHFVAHLGAGDGVC